MKETKPAPKSKKPVDALDALVTGDPKEVIAMLLWRNRLRAPELAMMITDQDVAAFRQCVDYLEVQHEVRIFRPMAGPQITNQVPANYVVACLVEKGTTNAIRPIENNEQDYAAAERAEKIRRVRDSAPQLVGQVRSSAQSGSYSDAEINELCEALLTLAKELRSA